MAFSPIPAAILSRDAPRACAPAPARVCPVGFGNFRGRLTPARAWKLDQNIEALDKFGSGVAAKTGKDHEIVRDIRGTAHDRRPASTSWCMPERVVEAAKARIADGTYQTLVFGVVDGDQSDVLALGTLDDGTAPNGDTVYEIGSITKTFTATLLAQEVLSCAISRPTWGQMVRSGPP
jgi:CubicO group peptidase (beta-lactamase class C family)